MNPIDYWYQKYLKEKQRPLDLTWKDVKILCDCFMDVGLKSDLPARSKALYEEILKRFNEQRKK